MSYFSWGKSNIEKEKLLAQVKELESKNKDLETKLEESNKYRIKNKKLKREYLTLAGTIEGMLQEQSLTKFLMFTIAVQCGGELQISNDSIEASKKLSETHDIDFVEDDQNLTYRVKRRSEFEEKK